MEPEKYVHGNNYDEKLTDIVPKKLGKNLCPFAQDALKNSIIKSGLLQPILVSLGTDKKLTILDGNRRWYAAQAAGCESLQVIYIDKHTETVSLAANMLRVDIPPIEKAEQMRKLKILFNYTNKDLGKMIGRSEPTVSEILSLNGLTDNIKEACRNNPLFTHSMLLKILRSGDPQAMENRFFKLQNKMTGNDGRGHKDVFKNVDKKVQRVIKNVNNVVTEFDKLDLNELDAAAKSNLNVAFLKLRLFCLDHGSKFSS